MPQCLCCKKNEGQIRICGNWIIYVCGQSDCRSPKGLTLGEWILDDTNQGGFGTIEDKEEFTIEINHKEYTIKNDKRIVKTLQNKIRDIILGKA